jgi:hypothetical protein
MIRTLIFAILAQLLASCATSVERKDGTIIRFELTGSVGDYIEAGRGFRK